MTDVKQDAETAQARAIIDGNRKRLRIRRWIALCSIPLVLVAVAFSGKLLSMYGFAHFAITTHVSGDAAGTVRASQGLIPLNWFESFIGPYDLGTGFAAGTNLEDARTQLETALPLAEGELQECAVRVNLTLVIEAQGDVKKEDGDTEGARADWQEALDTLTPIPATCKTEQANEASPDRDRSMQETIETTDKRIREKLDPPQEEPEQDPQDNPSEDPKPEDQPDQPDQDKVQDIQDQLDNGKQERDEADQEDSGTGGAEKPW